MPITKEFLEEKIITEYLDHKEIAKILKCSHKTVAYYAQKYKIVKPKRFKVGQDVDNFKILEVLKKAKIKAQCMKCGHISIKTNNKTGFINGCRKCFHKSLENKEEISDRVIGRIKNHAKKRNIKFDVTKEYLYELYLKQNRKCNLTGIEIKFPRTLKEYADAKGTASLDRVDSKKPYEPGNLQWVHKKINKMKNTLNQEEFVEWCSRVVDNQRRS